MPPAIMRTEIEKIPGVKRCWIEYEYGADILDRSAVLVVEVQTTDPHEGYDRDGTEEAVRAAIAEASTTMSFHRLRIVPSGK